MNTILAGTYLLLNFIQSDAFVSSNPPLFRKNGRATMIQNIAGGTRNYETVTETTYLQMEKEDSSFFEGFVRTFGVLSASSLLFLNTPASLAYDVQNSLTQNLPSIQISAVIKTIDLDMPSYGAVVDPTASIPSIEEAREKELELAAKKEKKDNKQKSPSSTASMNLPSFTKTKKTEKTSSPKKTKESIKKEKDDDDDKKAVKMEFVDSTMPSYGEGSSTRQKSVFSL